MIILKKYFWLFSFLIILCPIFTRAAAAENFQLIYDATAFTASTTLKVAASKIESGLPWQWSAITPVYSYIVSSRGFYNPGQILQVKINYEQTNNFLKQIFVYDDYSASWQPVVTKDNPQEKYVSADLGVATGRLIVLSNPDILTVGQASWYKFKGGLFAASPDFDKGSVVRVYNLNNNKTVDVVINDWGPDRSKHPDRVIDLDYQAFQKIASPGAGLVKVKIEPLKIAMSKIKKSQPQDSVTPSISASAAVLMSEKTGEILWGKQATKVLPLASLTKLVAVKIFLDTKSKLSKLVSYDKKDEVQNNRYCRPEESARLKLKSGDQVKIEDLIYSSLVGSANNTIETLVRVSGLSRTKFIGRMNEIVKTWGASNTKFIEPTGLSADNVSSPLDYAIITRELFSNPILQKASITKRYTFKTANTKQTHTVVNTNQLLSLNKYPIVGSKTGYLEEAGHCLMTRVESPQGNLIAINFGSKSKEAGFSDNEQLIRYGLRLLKK
ncbi:MAG: RlpA-like double-psi beta-barrel domain-containing protein [Patescibacteria group bacterium]